MTQEEEDVRNDDMVILLDDMPKDCITEAQKEILIEDAKRWGADYLIYATKFEGIHYFHYGIWKDMRPRFAGFPSFRYFDRKGNLKPAHSSLRIHFISLLDNDIIGLLSNGQYK